MAVSYLEPWQPTDEVEQALFGSVLEVIDTRMAEIGVTGQPQYV
jgi:hypothetical protein